MGRGEEIMNCPPVKSEIVRNQLCELLYYPGKCSAKCNRLYKRWLATEEEVRKLEEEAEKTHE